MADKNGNDKAPIDNQAWLWRWGIKSWLFIGVIGAIVVIGLIYGKAGKVILPLIIAVIIGVLLEPMVELLVKGHFPRWLATVVVMVVIIGVIVGFFVVVIYGVSSQAGAIGKQISQGVNKIREWAGHAKASKTIAGYLEKEIEKSWPSITSGLSRTLTRSVSGIGSFAIGLFIGFFILLFLLSDDGRIKEFVDGHLGVPREKGKAIREEVTGCFRGYFKGATIVAAVNAVVVIPVCLILKVPLIGAIVLVTFVTCYIPSFGGYIGGAFAVFIALASRGLTAAIIMLVFSIIAHTILQAPVQAIAYGKTLQLHPLVALLVTLFGAVFAGIPGAILAVPLAAVVMKVNAELKRAHDGTEETEATGRSSPLDTGTESGLS
ncbi:MAG: AI-2E family transporter [Candidatus Geothermincolia bacterium]